MTQATADVASPHTALASGAEIHFSREFDAPRELVFRAWAEPEHFARWFGPHGSTVVVRTMDVRPGGILHFCHRFAGHEDVWVRGVYREVSAPERLVFTVGFSDPKGRIAERPGFAQETEVVVTFAEHAGRTTVLVHHTGLTVDQGETQGWNESLDRLATLLATA